MPLKQFLLVLSFIVSLSSVAQRPVKDSIAVDTSFTDYDLLFDEMDAFFDSLLAPRSFTVINVGVSPRFFSSIKNDFTTTTTEKISYTPSIAYYDKSGFGLGVETSVIKEENRMNPYQFSITGSYDYIQNRKFTTGISLTHFITKKDLSFYTTPLQNEFYSYFTYRDFWLKPTVGVSYGWGNRTAYKEREEQITSIRLGQRGFSRINTTETINDFNVTAALRHDIYWLNVLSKRDFFRISPQVVFISGTQQFGFNQTSNSYTTVRNTGINVLYNTENISLDNNLYFQPISLSGNIRLEYSKGIFFLKPVVMFNYYFPAEQNNFSTSAVINGGILF